MAGSGSRGPSLGTALSSRRRGGLLIFEKARIELFGASGAEAVAENCARAFGKVGFDTRPVAFVVPDALAGGTNGEHSAEESDLREGHLQPLLLFSQPALQPGSSGFQAHCHNPDNEVAEGKPESQGRRIGIAKVQEEEG